MRIVFPFLVSRLHYEVSSKVAFESKQYLSSIGILCSFREHAATVRPSEFV